MVSRLTQRMYIKGFCKILERLNVMHLEASSVRVPYEESIERLFSKLSAHWRTDMKIGDS